MPLPFDQPAALSCGCNHQQNYGGLNTPGGTTSEILIDFANGSYIVDGQPVEIETLTAEDVVNWNTYDSADVVPGSGYPSIEGSGSGPVLAGAALQAVLDGATVVMDFDIVDDQVWFEIFDDTFTSDYKWQFASIGGTHTLTYIDATEFEVSPVAINNGHHKIAFTQLYGSMAQAIDGNVVEVVDSADAIPAPTIVGLYLDGGGASFIRSITIMPPQDNAELVGLSTL